jgi:hypothetical protein
VGTDHARAAIFTVVLYAVRFAFAEDLLFGRRREGLEADSTTQPPAVLIAEPVAPAGWYPDSAERHRERFWNGTEWTNERRAARVFREPLV